MPWGRLRAPHLHTPTKAVRMAEPPTTVLGRVKAFGLALPDDVAFSHVTAAQLWGLTLPPTLAEVVTLDVMRQTRRPQIQRQGCRSHRGLERREVVDHQGVQVTGLADTWVDLGDLTEPGLTLDELVIVGDEVATRLIGPPDPGEPTNSPAAVRAALEELRGALERRGRPRGKRRLHEALGLVRAPVRSPMETLARLMFVRAGFPEPAVNLPVLGEDGQWLLEGDLVWERQQLVGEYQGRDHASIRRRSQDAARAAVAGDHGWRVLEIFADDVYKRPRRIACLHRFARELGLDPAQLRIT